MKPIKLGMVGLGRAGNGMHLPELEDKEEMFQIYAVCDLIEERRNSVAEKYGAKAYATIEELVADPEVEIVDIATRSCDHYAHACMALKAGKSVFLEKPICCNYADAKALMELVDSLPDVKLYVRHNRRWEAKFVKAMEVVNSGIIGNVYEVKLTRNGFATRNDWQTIDTYGGGQLLNWGPHIIDQALNFAGGDYTDIYAETRQILASGNCEDHIKMLMTGINGRIVDMEISSGCATAMHEIVAYGDRGILYDTGVEHSQLEWRYVKPDMEIPRLPASDATPGTDPNFKKAPAIEWRYGGAFVDVFGERLDDTWIAMYEDYRLGKPYPILHSEALKVVEVISKIKEIMAAKTAK